MAEHDQYPMLRDMAESAEEITVPAVIVRELLAERDALMGERNRHGNLMNEYASDLVTVRNERDRLRAVVVAARMVLAVIDSARIGQLIDGIEGHDEITLLREKLAALDVSGEGHVA